MKSPRMRVKKEQKTSSQPWSLSQPRFIGSARAGRERRKVRNMITALTTPAVKLLVGGLSGDQFAIITNL